MDFKQIENSVKISESKSISEAAEELFITQSALNQQLIHLEEELGVKIFQRSKAGVSPTEAGREYLKYAKKMIAMKKEMLAVLNDYAACKTGTIRIGMPVIRGCEMFTHIFPAFHRKYPLIRLEPIEMSYSQRLQKIASGELDIAFITLTESERTADDYYPIIHEEICLAVSANHPMIEDFRSAEEVDLSCLKDQKFVLINNGTTLRKIINNLFRSAGFHPQVILETSSYQTISTIVSYNTAASLVPKLDSVDSNFSVKGRPYRTFCAVRKKGAYMSQPVRDFLEMSMEFWNSGSVDPNQ